MPAKKQITKDMILGAALKLLKEQGYDAVNIKQLSKELGCSTQPVYLSFSGMEDLRKELLPLAAGEFETSFPFFRTASDDFHSHFRCDGGFDSGVPHTALKAFIRQNRSGCDGCLRVLPLDYNAVLTLPCNL